ncbi:hypothetical protein C8R46DRAFT_46539 [Mycena filopes]|nr:hypothetical protein C8R46DRAFT_46539 [Mycena filopes]
MALFEYHPPQATIRHRLRYNILPTEEEKRRIADSLLIARDRLFAVRATGLTSAHYTSQDKALSGYISEYSFLLAPIQRLDTDVLALVFVTVHSQIVVDFRRRTFGHPIPLAAQSLASISYHWRCVAMQTPEIWSTISVKGWRAPRGLEYLRECLRNSKDHGLSLHVDLSVPKPTNMVIINELTMHAERWVTLKLSVRKTEDLHLFDPIRGRLSRLQQIMFDFVDSPSPPAVPIDAFVIAPGMHTIQVTRLQRMHCIPPLPFHQITEVSFINSNRIVVSDTLQLFISASRVDVSLDGQFRGPFTPPTPHPRTNLVATEVQICDEGPTTPGSMGMLETLTTPNLARLHLTNCLVWEGPSILPFLTRSAGHLRELVLQDTSVRVGDLLSLLRLTPTVEALVSPGYYPTPSPTLS